MGIGNERFWWEPQTYGKLLLGILMYCYTDTYTILADLIRLQQISLWIGESLTTYCHKGTMNRRSGGI